MEKQHHADLSVPVEEKVWGTYTYGTFNRLPGIEGSKPDASPAAVFLSHSVIRPSEKGMVK